MPTYEIGMAGIDVASLHSNQVPDKLVRWVHALFKEGDNNGMEFLLQQRISSEQLFVQELTQNTDQLVIDQGRALQTGLLQSSNLLFDDQLKRCGSNEQRRRRSGGVVEYCPNVNILVLIEGIHSLDTVRIQFMKDEADTSSSGQFHVGELLVVTLQYCTEFIAEFCDDIQNNVSSASE